MQTDQQDQNPEASPPTLFMRAVTSSARWDDLILPSGPLALLQDIANQIKHRDLVHDTWGFSKTARGLGVLALFAGPSGTGKTLAAEVLANELGQDLFRVNLRAAMNKYIGETEKNLRRIFDAAERGGAILLFDEADALFGKRSSVQGSHDRHANIEVSYLLQRLESYSGLAILETNFKDNIDAAFLRRFRFVVEFPFPDNAARHKIWKQAFPAQTPLHDDLDFAGLAEKYEFSGGNIQTMALNAAFLAAADGGNVSMKHVMKALRQEYGKIGKTLS